MALGRGCWHIGGGPRFVTPAQPPGCSTWRVPHVAPPGLGSQGEGLSAGPVFEPDRQGQRSPKDQRPHRGLNLTCGGHGTSKALGSPSWEGCGYRSRDRTECRTIGTREVTTTKTPPNVAMNGIRPVSAIRKPAIICPAGIMTNDAKKSSAKTRPRYFFGTPRCIAVVLMTSKNWVPAPATRERAKTTTTGNGNANERHARPNRARPTRAQAPGALSFRPIAPATVAPRSPPTAKTDRTVPYRDSAS